MYVEVNIQPTLISRTLIFMENNETCEYILAEHIIIYETELTL